jgi:hypothetical protein
VGSSRGSWQQRTALWDLVRLCVVASTLCGCDRTLHVTNSNGTPTDPVPGANGKLTAFIFTHTDCPVANRYAPELSRIHSDYANRGVSFYLVYVDPELSSTEIETHVKDYGFKIPALRDPYHELVELCGATVTPEVALFAPGARLLYCGRVDDRYDDFGKARAEASQRDLRDALDAALAGKPVPQPWAKAIGCYIADIETAKEHP